MPFSAEALAVCQTCCRRNEGSAGEAVAENSNGRAMSDQIAFMVKWVIEAVPPAVKVKEDVC